VRIEKEKSIKKKEEEKIKKK